MPEDPAFLVAHYETSREALLAAVEGLTDAQMIETTIDGWSVKDHLAHIAFWDDLRAQEVKRISAGYDSVWRMNGEQDEVFNNLAYEFRRHLSLTQARWEFDTTRQRLLDAIALATPRGLDGSLYGEAGLRSGHESEHAEWITRWRGERGH